MGMHFCFVVLGFLITCWILFWILGRIIDLLSGSLLSLSSLFWIFFNLIREVICVVVVDICICLPFLFPYLWFDYMPMPYFIIYHSLFGYVDSKLVLTSASWPFLRIRDSFGSDHCEKLGNDVLINMWRLQASFVG